MNAKVIVSLGSAILLASSLMASDMKEMKSEKSSKCGSAKMMKDKHHGRDNFMSNVMKLKLSDEQKTKIKDIKKENMQKMPKVSDAFSEKSFNKELYIKLSKDRKEYMIENKANMIEAVYNILDDSQKKELKNSMSK